ncbi:hypothetical protein H0H81_005540 [Sphagnurus paluster]|uniref:3'-5' exonuclease domain-containing protein n=1 Tax=Sphagnurus paluster TaxID=117069 RepID=A0A9P7GN21_9AGAR|nr:hypothetical protein H0H81_005540 [Sphagnurus paluster]
MHQANVQDKVPYGWRKFHPDAALHYIRDPVVADIHIAALTSPVGFDLEWKPVFTKNTPENPVALIQLANKHSILLIQISTMQGDVQKLYTDCDNAQWKGKYTQPIGLARLVEAYENLVLPKGRTCRSNWEAILSPQQTEYAANDAHAGFLIYERLMTMANAMDKVPSPAYYSFDCVRGRLCEPTGMHWNCYNPEYDPGPPPPPKAPKAPRASPISGAESHTPRAPVTVRDARIAVAAAITRVSAMTPRLTPDDNSKTNPPRGLTSQDTREGAIHRINARIPGFSNTASSGPGLTYDDKTLSPKTAPRLSFVSEEGPRIRFSRPNTGSEQYFPSPFSSTASSSRLEPSYQRVPGRFHAGSTEDLPVYSSNPHVQTASAKPPLVPRHDAPGVASDPLLQVNYSRRRRQAKKPPSVSRNN